MLIASIPCLAKSFASRGSILRLTIIGSACMQVDVQLPIFHRPHHRNYTGTPDSYAPKGAWQNTRKRFVLLMLRNISLYRHLGLHPSCCYLDHPAMRPKPSGHVIGPLRNSPHRSQPYVVAEISSFTARRPLLLWLLISASAPHVQELEEGPDMGAQSMTRMWVKD